MNTANMTTQFSDDSKLYYRTLWLSDIHLGNKDCHAKFLYEFLQRVKCDRLYLVGDIIDMLAMKNRVHWPESHTKVLNHIHELATSGTKVIYVPGNHDMPMRKYDQGLLLDIEIHRQYVHETREGKKLLLVHGDEFDHAVLYHALIKLIGDHAYGFMVFLNRWLDRGRRLFGMEYWSLATFIKENLSQAKKTIQDFEIAAAAEAKSRGLDGIVCGHIHKPELREIDGVMYCNDGDWTESCSALVETSNGKIELLLWQDIQQIIKTEAQQKPLTSAA